jgi:hypothetical protein
MYCMQITSTFYPSSSETNRLYTASQKRSTCWPGGFSFIRAMVLQVKEYSGDLQITDINLQVQIIILMLYIAFVRSKQL